MLNSPIDEIKSRLDIVDVLGSYIKLKKAGANFRALCPFHSEKNPSFFVSPSRQIWHCFGCNSGGDIFKFVMQIEGIEFGDALRLLAQRAGVELKPIKPELKTERKRFYDICELSSKFFEKQLEESQKGKEVKAYLLGRGINADSIKKWRLGWAPDTWRGLSDFLISKGYEEGEIEKAGIYLRNEQGSHYDRFRGRIMFPIYDLNSQVVGFGGRIFQKNEEVAKYINTPNTILYDKSRILYGLDKAKVPIRKKDFCLLVEGYTDVILAHQVGLENTVATSGTALTIYQLSILKRYSENLYLAFDMDIAGDSATKRGIDLAQIKGFNIRIISLPQDKDPADIIAKDPKEFEKLLEKPLSILDFYFQNTFSKFDKATPEGKKAISKILLPVIKRIPNKIEQSFWVARLARDLGAKEIDVEEELKKVKLEEETLGLETEEIINLPPKSRKELLEERLLILILKQPERINLMSEEKTICFSQKGKDVLLNLEKDLNPENLSQESKDFFNYLALRSEVEEIDAEEILGEIKLCLKELQCLEVKNKLNEISKEIKQAEGEKDFKKVEKLSKTFTDTAGQLTNL